MSEEDKKPLFIDLDYGAYGSAEQTLQHLSEDEMQYPTYYISGTFFSVQKCTYSEPVRRDEIFYVKPPSGNSGMKGIPREIVFVKRKNPKYSCISIIDKSISEDNVRLRAEIERLKRELAQARNQANVATANMSKAMSDMSKTVDVKRNTNNEISPFTPGGMALPRRYY